jgi:BNR repeat-like domain/BNR/Asp-box repeat
MRRITYVATFTCALLLVVAQTAFAATVVTASGPSPFAACSQPAVGGTNFLNTEVEPYLAVNPSSTANLIAVYQQDRWSNGGARGLVAAASFDGGATWGAKSALPFNQCAGDPNYERASDPWVSIGPDGIAYAVGLSFNVANNNNAVAAVVSKDGGKTWSTHRYLIRDDNQNQFFDDKESVTADPSLAKTAYAVWDRLVGPADNPAVAAHNFHSFTGPAWFSKTTDGGKTWSAPQIIVPTGQNQQTIDNQIVVGPDGTLYDFTDLILTTGANKGPLAFAPHGLNEVVVKSIDGGATWSSPTLVTHMSATSVFDPNTGAYIRTHDFGGVPAVDMTTGQLYFAWQSAALNPSGSTQVLLTTSTDGGATWKAPAVVSASPATTDAFQATIAVASDGSVGLYYYDFRSLTAGNTTTLPTDVWFRKSAAGGASFGAETHVTGPFNMLAAARAAGFFVGDYNGMVAVGTSYEADFGVTTCNDTSCSATGTPPGSNPSDIDAASLP